MFLSRVTEKYRAPLVQNTVRLSIRSLNKAIEVHSLEQEKTKLIYNQLVFLIGKIPKNDLSSYSKHCLPFAVMHNNHVAVRLLIEQGGLRPERTWSLFQAIWLGYREMARDLVYYTSNYVEESDIIPLMVAAYHGDKINLTELLGQEYPVIPFYDKNKLRELCHKQAIWTKEAIKQYYLYDNRIMKERCAVPRANVEQLEKTVTTLLQMTKFEKPGIRDKNYWECDPSDIGYSIGWYDRLVQLCRAYGVLKWGWLEYGGHQEIEWITTPRTSRRA